MSEREFFQYFSQLVDVCFTKKEDQSGFEYHYLETSDKTYWPVGKVIDIFDQNQSGPTPQPIIYNTPRDESPKKLYGW